MARLEPEAHSLQLSVKECAALVTRAVRYKVRYTARQKLGKAAVALTCLNCRMVQLAACRRTDSHFLLIL